MNDTFPCKHCKENIKVGAKVCSTCGRPQRLLFRIIEGNWSSLTIALIAIVLSCVTFYVQFFKVTHRFQASVFNATHENGILEVDILFLNSGNRSETLLEAYFFFPSKDNSNESMHFCNKGLQSFTIKPGEQALYHYREKIDSEHVGSFYKSTGENKAFPFGMKFKVVGRNMYPFEREVRVGSLLKTGNSTFTTFAVVDLTPE